MTTWLPLTPSRRQVAIAGRVREAITQRAIAAAVVTIAEAPPEFYRALALKQLATGGSALECGQRPIVGFSQATSAADGWFYLLNLPPGRYALTAALPGAGTRYGPATVALTVAQTVAQTAEGHSSPAIAEFALPTTALGGTVTHGQRPTPMARIQVEGSPISTFSDAQGAYLLTGLEVWPASDSPQSAPRPRVQVLARGYPALVRGVPLSQGRLTTQDFDLATA